MLSFKDKKKKATRGKLHPKLHKFRGKSGYFQSSGTQMTTQVFIQCRIPFEIWFHPGRQTKCKLKMQHVKLHVNEVKIHISRIGVKLDSNLFWSAYVDYLCKNMSNTTFTPIKSCHRIHFVILMMTKD